MTSPTTNSVAPALKEWAAIVHALLEGEQIVDVRKGGLREDGRHFDVTSRCLWLYPTAEHQRAELLKPAYRHWIDLAGLPADPASRPAHPALSDVAFEAKRKGVREALPAECWQA